MNEKTTDFAFSLCCVAYFRQYGRFQQMLFLSKKYVWKQHLIQSRICVEMLTAMERSIRKIMIVVSEGVESIAPYEFSNCPKLDL